MSSSPRSQPVAVVDRHPRDRLARSLLEILRSDVLPGLPAAMLQSADERLRTTRLLRLEPVASASIGALTVLLLAPGLGADPQFGAPAEFARAVADDLAKWTRLARDAGLKVE